MNTCKCTKFSQNIKRISLCKNNNVGPKMHDPQDADYFGQLLEWGQQVMSNNRALFLGTKYSYFQSWTRKTDSQTCQSNHIQHVPRYSWTVGNKNKLLLKGLFSDEVHLWQTIVSPGTSGRDIEPTGDRQCLERSGFTHCRFCSVIRYLTVLLLP